MKPLNRPWLRAISTLLGAGLLTSCQASTPRGPTPGATSQCIVTDGASEPIVTIGIAQRIDASNAPVPRTPSERLVFRQLYETLVSLDCNGAITPLIAENWEASEQGAVWRFRIREDVRYWDGSVVTARDIAESWAVRSDSVLPIAGITVLGERELRVTLQSAIPGVERFADPALAVARHMAGGWPLGTGKFRPEPGADPRMFRIVSVSPSAVIPLNRPRPDSMTWPRAIVFRAIGNDARAALDARIDGVVTADPAPVEYSRALSYYNATPLGWTRTYVLGTRGAQRADSLSATPAAAEIAPVKEAIRADTRAAEPPFWWQRAECVPATFSPVRTDTRNRNVVYPVNDPIARGIAERLVALAWPAARAPAWLRVRLGDYSALGSPTAVGVDERTLLQTMRTGRALAVVIALPRPARSACINANDASSAALLGSWSVSPLLDAREYLIHRGAIGHIFVDGDGVIRFGAATR
ncbi:MAG: ABC transporter substrate-binding protein [Gemmatimonadota bacterium]